MPIQQQQVQVTPAGPGVIIPPVVVPPAPPAPPAKSMAANIVAAIGIVMSVIGYGYQAVEANNPGALEKMSGLVDLGTLAGVFVTLGGLGLHTLQANKNEKDAKAAIDTTHAVAVSSVAATHAGAVAAVEAAEISPPADPQTGQRGSSVTIAAAVEQAMNEGNYKLAAALVKSADDSSTSKGAPA